MLPSRRKPLQDAMQAARGGETVFVAGALGSGRTTFALSLFRQLGHHFYWVTGAAALREVPFAVLTGLCSQIPDTQQSAGTPGSMIAALTGLVTHTETWILLDRAEEVDEQSAAVLAQLATAQHLHLVVATCGLRQLPQCLGQLAAMHHSHRVQIKPLDMNDAQFMASEHLGGPVNSTTTRRLLQSSGGSPLHLRELMADARAVNALCLAGGYWTLHPLWEPTGERITDLVHTRLSQQAEPLRATVVRIAITGTLPLPLARTLLGAAELDAVVDAGLARIRHHGSQSNGSRSVGLVPDLPASTVVASLGRGELRSHLESLITAVDGVVLGEKTRTNIAVLCREVGIEPPAADLLKTVSTTLAAQRYSSVLSLTEHLESEVLGEEEYLRLLAARAMAQHESGDSAAGLATLGQVQGTSNPIVRLAAAQIHLSRGQLDQALGLLEARAQDPPKVEALRQIVLNAKGSPDTAHLLLRYSTDPRLSTDLQVQALTQYCVWLAYRGRPSRTVDLLVERLMSVGWPEISPSGQGRLFAALHPVLLMEGSTHHELHSKLVGMEEKVPLVNCSRYLLARGSIELDQGHAGAAVHSLAQAMSLAQLCDPELMLGVMAALRARAAGMLGDREQMRRCLDIAESGNWAEGKWSRLEAERALLPVILQLRGSQEARAHAGALLGQAEELGLPMLTLRIQHDAWRLGLSEDPVPFSSLAGQLEGELAKTLSGYAAAVDTLGPELEQLVQRHVDQGRLLYAAELANHGSEVALARGMRARSSQLLGLCADICRPLASVNTPRLGRARIDPGLLSDREFAACTRAARGESNTAIAAALFLSPRTVEGHLQRSYAKLGIRDRRQLIDESEGTPGA
ncbi:LuxR C-terminal-related transcriptional regulator [Glutamicibacter sp. MNS18]|uniref:LuxR C-terminal-related transcriptional regulator n=1 Tax=Glutamicibacter sp. MNS18 TaxID=2989817 RepID=UPI002236A818|nr:LuxR C-terminal-related transcriptional regulator [Glutamicibacter sp. MNS18]MCW4464958.1 LuxR C-terminal-related transcriptional regulator [Glutamicibacter sp. MNS18]